ncbi:MAG: sigma-70 family RNA polymerase sigma factor [Planctomycetota bacterium]|jgi:RNA polymerase sigma factor (TIGR02999 family)
MSSQPEPDAGEITRLLSEVEMGRTGASARLLTLVYDELRGMARARMAGERPDHTLGATALVHETYLRLAGGQEPVWSCRAHFFLAAGDAMRKILIDHARKRGRLKRGGQYRRMALDVADLADEKNLEEIMAVDDALQRLELEDERAAKIVKLRFFAGLSVEDTAAALGLSERTVAREWAFARAWLFRTVGEGSRSGRDGECRDE